VLHYFYIHKLLMPTTRFIASCIQSPGNFWHKFPKTTHIRMP